MVMAFIFILLFDQRTSERLFDIVYFFTMNLKSFLLQETDVQLREKPSIFVHPGSVNLQLQYNVDPIQSPSRQISVFFNISIPYFQKLKFSSVFSDVKREYISLSIDSRGYNHIMNTTDLPTIPETIQTVTNEVITVVETTDPSGTNYMIYIIAVVAILIVFFVLKKGKSKSSKREIGIVGERGSGKTQLFIGLSKGLPLETVPSISNNTCEIQIGNNKYKLCDFIGDNLSKEEVVGQIARFHTIIHVVDGADSKKLGDAALFIYKVLISKQFQKESCNYLLFLNKSDSSSFHGEQKLVKRIEDEIETIKATRRNGTEQNEEGDEDYIRKERTRFDLKREGIQIVVGSSREDRKRVEASLEELCG